jgi:hypothetical protein
VRHVHRLRRVRAIESLASFVGADAGSVTYSGNVALGVS